jgi:hypothetical protein
VDKGDGISNNDCPNCLDGGNVQIEGIPMHPKKNFRYGERVELENMGNTGFSPYEGLKGTIVGIATIHIVDTYIVEMDEFPNEHWEWKCITVPEGCLKRI